MALAGELMRYIGNEFVPMATKTAGSALSSVLPSAVAKAGTGLATKAVPSMLEKASALGLSKNGANKWILDTGILDTDEGVGKIKDFMNPILGGDKTPSYQRFLEQIGEGEYQMGHRPNLYVGDSETKFPLSNMEADPDYLPKIYGDNEASTVRNLLMLGNTGPDAQMSAKIIAQYQNQPDKMVKIFRQAPKDMNYGDWVGLTKEYADNHIGNSPNNQLWEREVPASEVMFAGDDINEWGYYPKQVQLDDELGTALDDAIRSGRIPSVVDNRPGQDIVDFLASRGLEETPENIAMAKSMMPKTELDMAIQKSGKNLRPVRHIPVQQDTYIPLYHQTSANSLADFSLDKRSAGVSDATMPEGIFLKETDADIGLPGKNQLQLDAKLNNPLKVINRDDLKAKLMAMNPKVAKYLRAETDLDNYYEKLSEEAQTAVDKAYEKMYYDKSDANKKAFAEATEKMKSIIPEWREKIRENAANSQKEIKKLLKDNGYDGMIMDEDRGSFGRKVKSYLVLDKEQLRDNSVPVRIKKYLDDNILSDDDASILMQNYDANRANKLNGNDTSADELIVRNVAKKNGISEKTMGLLKNYSTLTNDRNYQKNKTLLNKILTRENKDINALDKMSRKLLGAMGIEYENEMPVVYRAVTANEENSLSYTLDRKIAENLVKNDDTYKKVIRYVVKPNDIVIAPQFLGPLDTGGDLLHIIVKKA